LRLNPGTKGLENTLMSVLYPLTFEPIFKERIWGGRELETFYHKPLPQGVRIGESWEVSDRPGDASKITNGPLAGKTLRWLMEEHATEMLGNKSPVPAKFPLLIKIIDAQDKLSLQVHPPKGIAEKFGGDPKTEMWYVVKTKPGAELYVGLKKGVTRAEFEQKIANQTVAECFHRIPVSAGDSIFLQSGRVHALGASTLIFEVQQNSDTTYRVFDWNRVDASGKPRELHVAQSLASIDFNDFEPSLLPAQFNSDADSNSTRPLVSNDLFNVSIRRITSRKSFSFETSRMRILGLLEGTLTIKGAGQTAKLCPGQFCLLPASVSGDCKASAGSKALYMDITL